MEALACKATALERLAIGSILRYRKLTNFMETRWDRSSQSSELPARRKSWFQQSCLWRDGERVFARSEGGIEMEGETSHPELPGVIPAMLRLQRGAHARHRKSRQPLGFDTENPLKKVLERAP